MVLCLFEVVGKCLQVGGVLWLLIVGDFLVVGVGVVYQDEVLVGCLVCIFVVWFVWLVGWQFVVISGYCSIQVLVVVYVIELVVVDVLVMVLGVNDIVDQVVFDEVLVVLYVIDVLVCECVGVCLSLYCGVLLMQSFFLLL